MASSGLTIQKFQIIAKDFNDFQIKRFQKIWTIHFFF